MRMFGLRYYDAEPVDLDLPERLGAIHTADWNHLIARLDVKAPTKAVAWALAAFASEDGSDVRPALWTVADMCHLHETSVSAHIKVLVKLGMLVIKKPGGGRSNPTVYRLTRPADITTLPLWLDADMKRVPAGAAFIAAETPAPTLGNEDSSNTDSQAPALGNDGSPSDANTYSPAFTKGVYGPTGAETPAPTLPFEAETPAPTLGNRPVDNRAEGLNPSVFDPKPQRFYPENPETPVPTLGDLLQADLTTDQPGLPQASNSLGQREDDDQPRHPMSVGQFVESPDAQPWTPPAEPDPAPPSPIVQAAAVLSPVPALAAALALLEAQPGGGEWFRAAAGRELRAEGIRHPRPLDIALRAIVILRRTDPETRSA